MATRRRGGLDDDQVAKLRQDVADGRRPRVAVSGGQFPDGTTGTVVRVGDAAAEGSEFITVRIKAGAVTDELGFAPSELAVPGRAKSARATRSPRSRAVATSPASAPEPHTEPPSASVPALPAEVAPVAKAAPAKSVTAKAAPMKATAPATATATATAPAARTRPVGAARRPTSVPSVTITVASSGVSWTVSATRGARAVVKKAPLAPGIVTALAALLELPEIDEAVTAVNGAALDEAEARAARLRAELAEIEAVLVSHRPPH